jgi:hypothetical protein
MASDIQHFHSIYGMRVGPIKSGKDLFVFAVLSFLGVRIRETKDAVGAGNVHRLY